MLFDEIKVLLVLSKAKSLSQAADKLYISRPGLSQKVAGIERKFGAPLITRTPTGITLTPAGEKAVKFAQNVIDMERTLASQIAAIDEHFPANVNVGTSINDGVALLPGMVAEFMKVEPRARVHLDLGYEPDLIAKLKNGEVDFALVENQTQEPDIVLETLGYTKLVFIGPNKPPYNQAVSPVPVDLLLEWPMIIYEWNSGRHMVGNRHFRDRYGISLRDHNMVANFDSHEAMVEGVKAGIGWASIPECIYNRYSGDPDIIRFKVDTQPLWYPVSLAWNSDHIISDYAQDFRNFVSANIPEGYFSRSLEAYLDS